MFGAVLMIGAAVSLRAQEPASDLVPGGGAVDFGFRLNSNSGDPARNQRYRDLREGPTVDRMRYSHDNKKWVFTAEGDHVGYRDQRYFG